LNASLAAISLLQGQVKTSYLTREKRLTAALHPQVAKESPPLKEDFFKRKTGSALREDWPRYAGYQFFILPIMPMFRRSCLSCFYYVSLICGFAIEQS
jgi:hypothetical protein